VCSSEGAVKRIKGKVTNGKKLQITNLIKRPACRLCKELLKLTDQKGAGQIFEQTLHQRSKLTKKMIVH